MSSGDLFPNFERPEVRPHLEDPVHPTLPSRKTDTALARVKRELTRGNQVIMVESRGGRRSSRELPPERSTFP